MSRPEQTAGAADRFDAFGPWRALRDSSMESWSKLMQDFVLSDEYARASAQWLDTYLTMSQPFQEAIDQAMTQTLSQYKLPSTDDITRLAQRLSNIELRLDDLDASLDEIRRLLRGLAGGTTTVQADVPAAPVAPSDNGTMNQNAVPEAEGDAVPSKGRTRRSPTAHAEGGKNAPSRRGEAK